MSGVKQCVICVECGLKTKDFYLVANNKGKTHKCKNCYELGLMRSSRNDYTYKDVHYTANSIKR